MPVFTFYWSISAAHSEARTVAQTYQPLFAHFESEETDHPKHLENGSSFRRQLWANPLATPTRFPSVRSFPAGRNDSPFFQFQFEPQFEPHFEPRFELRFELRFESSFGFRLGLSANLSLQILHLAPFKVILPETVSFKGPKISLQLALITCTKIPKR